MYRRQWFGVRQRQKSIAQFGKVSKFVVLHPSGRRPSSLPDRQRVHDVCGTPEAGIQRVQVGETKTGRIFIVLLFQTV
jgi:hypothetical protein